MKNLVLRGIVVGPVQTNCYFLKNRETEEIIVVDPGAEDERIRMALERLGGRPAAILLTHGHYDHICAAKELKEHYRIPIYAPKAEEELLQNTSWNLSAAWSGKAYKVQGDVWLEDGQETDIAGFQVKTILTPRPYCRFCLLLASGGRGLLFRGYGFCRLLRKNRFAYRKHEPDERKPGQDIRAASGRNSYFPRTRGRDRCRV